jgi:hypothetical protein
MYSVYSQISRYTFSINIQVLLVGISVQLLILENKFLPLKIVRVLLTE